MGGAQAAGAPVKLSSMKQEGLLLPPMGTQSSSRLPAATPSPHSMPGKALEWPLMAAAAMASIRLQHYCWSAELLTLIDQRQAAGVIVCVAA